MSKELKLSLSTKSIKELIKKLDKIPQIVEKETENSVKEVMAEAYIVTVLESRPVDTGETRNSTEVTVANGKGILSQTGDHVFENEFGDGLDAGKYPGIRPSSFPTHSGSYTFTPTNPQSRYYHVKGNGEVRTLTSEGQHARAQMYKGGQYIRNNLPRVLKEKVSGALSKI